MVKLEAHAGHGGRMMLEFKISELELFHRMTRAIGMGVLSGVKVKIIGELKN